MVLLELKLELVRYYGRVMLRGIITIYSTIVEVVVRVAAMVVMVMRWRWRWGRMRGVAPTIVSSIITVVTVVDS